VRNETGGNRIATVVVRASTDNIADDIERAIEDGVNAYKVSCAVCTLANH
jgi:T-complex protein 1 subunit theta